MRGLMLTAAVVLAVLLGSWSWIYKGYDSALTQAQKAYDRNDFTGMKNSLAGYESEYRSYPVRHFKFLSTFGTRLAYMKGLADSRLGHIEQAEAAFRLAAGSPDPRVASAALYNLAEYMIIQEELEGAADIYRQALMHVPGDLQTQINLELLLKKIEDKGKGENDQKDDQKETKTPSADVWLPDNQEDGMNKDSKRIWK